MLDEASPLGKEISCMMPVTVTDHQAPVPPPSYQRGQARLGPALHIDALTLVTTLHLLALCQLAVRLAHHRCPPPLPAGPGGAPRTGARRNAPAHWRGSRTRLPALVSGYARLVEAMACFGSGLRVAVRQRWNPTHTQSFTAMQTSSCCRGSCALVPLRGVGLAGHATAAQWSS